MYEPLLDSFSIWSTSVVFGVTEPRRLTAARAILDQVLADVEQAASRFRPGTEILQVNKLAGQGPLPISPMLADLVAHALWAADVTDGACDPTVADALVALGYDRDFDEIDAGAPANARPTPGTAGILLDPERRALLLPAGTHLDLGATAKARAADMAAVAIAEQLETGVLVDIGGDLRAAGPPPPGGWRVGITASARNPLGVIEEVVAITAGGVASSSSVVRSWTAGDDRRHHIVDPRTGSSATTSFSLVTVAAPTCVEANAFSTAAVVWGENALFELPQRGLVARLVRHDGTVERIGGWPEQEVAA